MQIKKKILGGAVVVGSLLAVLPASQAHAQSNVSWSSGDVRRAIMWENDNGGAAITNWGSTNCTARTSDMETINNNMAAINWNDVVSAVNDFAGCDVNLFENGNFSVSLTNGYRNFGGGSPVFVGHDANDKTSSYSIS